MGLRRELAGVSAFLLPGGKFVLHKFDKQLFRFDAGNLDVAVRIAVHRELHLDFHRKGRENCGGSCGEARRDEGGLFVIGSERGVGFALFREKIVEFGNQALEIRDELDQAFGDQCDAEVVSVRGAFRHGVREDRDDFVRSHFLCLDFL